MSKYKFDEYGNITPYQVHSGDIETVFRCFVDKYNGKLTTRKMIWYKYTKYNNEVLNRIKIPFKQLYFGSFITKKKTPSDIDIINIIHHSKTPLLQDMQGEEALDKYATDAYFIPEYEENNPNNVITKALINKKIKYGLFDDRKKKRQSMLEIEINYV